MSSSRQEAENHEAIESMAGRLDIVRDCLAQKPEPSEFDEQRQMVQDLLHDCEASRDHLGRIAEEVAENENMAMFNRVSQELDRLERYQTEFSAWTAAGPGGAVAAAPSPSGPEARSDSRGGHDDSRSLSGGAAASAAVPPPSSSLSEVSTGSGRRDKSKKDKKEKKDKKKPGSDDGFGSGFGAATDAKPVDGRGTPASASGFGTWLSPTDDGSTPAPAASGAAVSSSGAWGSGASDAGKWPSAGSTAPAWDHGTSDAFPKEGTGSSLAAGSSASAAWGPSTGAGLEEPPPSFGGGFSDTAGSAGASGASWAAAGSPKDLHPPGPPSATILGQPNVQTILPSGTTMQGSSSTFGTFPDDTARATPFDSSRATPFDSAWSLGAPTTPQSAPPPSASRSVANNGHMLSSLGASSSHASAAPAHGASSHAGSLGDPGGWHRATMHMQVPYRDVSGDIDAFSERFARAAAQAVGVPAHRVRVRAVRPCQG